MLILQDLRYFLPMQTNACNMREHGKSRAIWNERTFLLSLYLHFEELLINEDAEKLLKANILYLFEILDFSPNLLLEKDANLTKDGFYRIAWAFLRPIGNAKIHLDSMSKLQLYEYKMKPHFDLKKSRFSLAQETPDVYYEFIWSNKTKYPGYLNVAIKTVDKPDPSREYHKKTGAKEFYSTFVIEKGRKFFWEN